MILSCLVTFVQDVKWLQTITSLPILVKGVLTAEDGKQNKTCLRILLIHFLTHFFRYTAMFNTFSNTLVSSLHIKEVITTL